MSNFTFTPLDLPGVLLVRPRRFEDRRGYFMETYCAPVFAENGAPGAFVQDNQSGAASRGTVRGLHFQAPPHAQAKLVRVLKGAIYDVAVDIRRCSPTYGRWCASELSAAGGEQIYVPRGFAHAFCTLEDDTHVAYKVDDYYAPGAEGGLRWDDPDLAIDWPAGAGEAALSERDLAWPAFETFDSPFEQA